MKKILNTKLKLLLLTFLISSCSFLNEKQVSVPITSNPVGADLYIEGQYYGKTPKIVKLEPSKNYSVTAVKDGYGMSNINLETWYSVRGGRGGDNFRCVLDALGTMLVIPAFGFYSVHCRDFKLKNYTINIANTGYQAPGSNSSSPANNRNNYNNGSNSYQNNNYNNYQNYPSNNGYNGNSYNNNGNGYNNNYPANNQRNTRY